MPVVDTSTETGAEIQKHLNPGEVPRLCQHMGNWGPWYHISVYRHNAQTGKYRYSHQLRGWSHMNKDVARTLHKEAGIGFGRPE